MGCTIPTSRVAVSEMAGRNLLARGFDPPPDRVQKRPGLLTPVSYCASTQVSDPASLTATFENVTLTGLPSAVPR
jgi:hypothetical protein